MEAGVIRSYVTIGGKAKVFKNDVITELEKGTIYGTKWQTKMSQKDVGNKVPIYKLNKTDEVMKYYDEWGEGNKYDKVT